MMVYPTNLKNCLNSRYKHGSYIDSDVRKQVKRISLYVKHCHSFSLLYKIFSYQYEIRLMRTDEQKVYIAAVHCLHTRTK